MGSSQTRARTRVPCIGRQILNHCAIREAPATPFDVAEAASLPMATLAQQAELYALKWACTLAKGKTANIYTDGTV